MNEWMNTLLMCTDIYFDYNLILREMLLIMNSISNFLKEEKAIISS